MSIRVRQIGELPKPVKSANRDGFAWRLGETLHSVACDWANPVIGYRESKGSKEDIGSMSDTEEKFQTATNEVNKAYEVFDAARKKLKSSLANDTASIASSCDKIESNMAKARASIDSVERQLLTDSMLQAIVNAERLAAALTAISAVRPANLTFAVLGNEPKKQP